MGFSQDDGLGGMSEADEVPGKGKEYGERVHEAAQAVKEGWLVNDDFPEMEMIRRIVDGCRDADLLFAELDCTLPVPDCGIVLSGRIDLLAVYPDRVEVHDYKTDVSDRFEQEYMFQLSVYAEAASLYYKRRAVCFIDYVSMGRTKRFEPLTGGTLTDEIRRRSEEGRPSQVDPDALLHPPHGIGRHPLATADEVQAVQAGAHEHIGQGVVVWIAP